jgi:hypothetical protein
VSLETSYEREGYDGKRGRTEWWFEAWGSGNKSDWTMRRDAGRPPTPDELARADYIVFGFRRGRAEYYKTRVGGLDLNLLKR